MTYFFNIQYDHDEDDTHVYTFHSEGENVEQAIARFREIYDTERVLSVEMLAPTMWDKAVSAKDEDIRMFGQHEREMRERVIYALNDTERRYKK